MTDGWKAYYPDDGETSDDARRITPRWDGQHIFGAEDAAYRACQIDFDERDGWERTQGEPFPIIVIAPDGTETRWSGYHEASVEHTVREAEDE